MNGGGVSHKRNESRHAIIRHTIFTSAPSQKLSVKLGTRLIGPVPLEIVTDRAKAVRLLLFSLLLVFGVSFVFPLDFYLFCVGR